MKLPSASQLTRAEACPASCSLPHVERDDSHGYREAGVALDAFVSRVVEVGVDAALKETPAEHRDAFALLDLSSYPLFAPGALATQVAFAWAPETGEALELGRGTNRTHRDYSRAPPDSLVGTADFVGLTDESVVIGDLKRTSRPLGPPKQALQLLFLAVAASRVYGRSEARVGWVREVGGTVTQHWETLDAFELDDAAERIRRVVEAVQSEAPKMAEGGWCRYCPAFAQCPAKATLVAAAATGLEQWEVEGASDEQLGKAWDRSNALIEVAEHVRRVVLERVSRGELALPRGRVLRLVEVERRVLEVEGVRQVLPEAVEVKESASQASVRRALVARHGAKGVQRRVDELVAALEAAGHVRRTAHAEAKELMRELEAGK